MEDIQTAIRGIQGIPEPHYQCAGQLVFNVDANAEIHTRNRDDGYRTASHLFWVTLRDRESGEECTDFFCQECLESMGKKTGGKKTLRQVMEASIQQELEETRRKVMRTFRVA